MQLRSRNRDGIPSFLIACREDDIDFEAGDVSGGDEAGVGEEFAGLGGGDGAEGGFVFGGVVLAGAEADFVVREIEVGAGGPGEFGFELRRVPGDVGGDRVGSRSWVGAELWERQDQRVGFGEQAGDRFAIVAERGVGFVLGGGSELAFQVHVLIGSLRCGIGDFESGSRMVVLR